VVTLRLTHDDGLRSRDLIADVRLSGVPRVGDRIRAGRAGNFFPVEKVLWDEQSAPTVYLTDASETDADVNQLTRSGWRVAFETQAARRPEPSSNGSHRG
jgi:hypothetical protein